MHLNKEDLVRMLLGYQGKFKNILHELKNYLNELKTKFFKLESDLQNVKLMNSTPEENASKFRALLLKRGIRTFRKSAGDFGCN